MNITQVKVFPLENSKVKAMASITIDESFVVTGLKVLEGSKGLFVSMPSNKKADGTYKDICFPVTAEARQMITDAVLIEYSPKQGEQNEVCAECGKMIAECECELPF